MTFVGYRLTSPHRGALTGKDTRRPSVSSNGFDPNSIFGRRHPNLSFDGNIGRDDANRMPFFVGPDEYAFSSTVNQSLLSLRI